MKKYQKIIDTNPAAYPETNTPEYNAVVTLIHILNKGRIKFEINILDKFPNWDGIFEIVTVNQIPIGKVDVQVKILGAKNLNNPKYQCDKAFLGYCQESILPVLLIVVDVKSETAYWIHISRELIKGLSDKIKGDSINVNIPATNIISKTDLDYITQWSEIVDVYISRLINYETIEAELLDIKARHAELQKITNPALGAKKKHFKEIHLFLDYYNDLLNREFSVIKDVFYREYWRIGVAYSDYSENSLRYSLYPISHDSNDIQIKEIDHEKALSQTVFLNYVSHYRDNPIKKRPLEYAYKYIIEDLKKVVDNKTLLPIGKFIAIEYVIAFIDRNHELIGLNKDSSTYSLNEIGNALSTFLPMFCEMFYKMDRATHSTSEVQGIDIDYFRWHVMPEDIKKNGMRTRKKIEVGYAPTHKFSFQSMDFDLKYLNKLIAYLKLLGNTEIQRTYPNKIYPKKNAYYQWEVYQPSEVKEILTLIFKNLPKIYDSFIGEYFPNLMEQIKYFAHFNRLIVNIRIKENSTSFTDSPSIELIGLKNLSNAEENRIDVYLIGEDDSPVTWVDISSLWEKNLEFDGYTYKLISSSTGILDNIYHQTPMQDYLYDTLKNRLEDYLKPYHDGVGIFRFTRY